MAEDAPASSKSAPPALPAGRYQGWAQPPVTGDDGELTRTGRGTPAGEYLRRFWQPVALSEDVGELPVALRILGEDLVLFRDRSGRIGLLHRYCSHRGASLEFGIVGERGIRCCYHGWKYDVDGTILETPALPAEVRIAEKLAHGAYPAIECCGLVFAYMGPPGTMPPFPQLDAFTWPQDNEMRAYKLHFPCNWLQVHENGADPMHVPFVHALISEVQFTEMMGALPVVDNAETPVGFLSLATRRWGGMLYVRANDVILPNMAQFGTPFVRGDAEKFALCAGITRWVVPVDDASNLTFGIRHFNTLIDPHGEGRRDLIGAFRTDGFGQTSDRPYEERQRNPGDWDAQGYQRPVALHGNEHLVAHDSGVVMLRRQLREGIRAVAAGRQPAQPRLYAGDTVVPTYVAEIVKAGARDAPLAEQQRALYRFGREVAQSLLDTQHLPPEARQQGVESRLRAMDTEGLYRP